MKTTLGQQRAEYSLDKLKDLSCKRDDFKTLAAGLPALILQNGFGQALAFLLAKGKDKHVAAYQIIAGWLEKKNLVQADQPAGILRQISTMPQSDYLHAQQETLAMLEWLKRYANAELFGGQT